MTGMSATLKAQFVRAAIACAAAMCLLLPLGAKAAEPAIALGVLPFANASGETVQDAFADGLTDEIGALLARVRDLHVGARVSAFRYRGPTFDIQTVGQALGRSHLVLGNVRRMDDRIRLEVRLVRAEDGEEIWFRIYNTPFSTIFDVEEDIARRIAAALGVPLGVSDRERFVRSLTADMEAYDKYLRAKPLIRARGQRPFAEAAVLLEQAVAADANFAPALALLAFDYDLTPLYSQALRSSLVEEARRVVDSAIPKAEMLAQRAAEHDPTNSAAFVALAYAQMVQRRMLAADGTFRQALLLDPDNTDGLHGYSQLLAAFGRIEEAIAMRERLQALEPFVANYVADTAEIVWLGGDNDRAIRMLNDFRPGRTSELAQVQASLGRYREAAGLLREMNPANYLPGLLETSASLLESAPARTASPESLPKLGNLGWIYLHAGAPERVFEYYEANVQAGYFQPISTTWFWHPSYAQLRKTERFKNYMRDLGFVEVWRASGWPPLCRPLGAGDFVCD